MSGSSRTPSDPPADVESDNWLGVVMASAAVTVVTLDLYGVNVALPSIQDDLGVTDTTASTLIVVYSLSLTVLLVPLGRLADRVGRRIMLTLGLLAFGALSLVCAVSTTGVMLVFARLGQGAAAAAVAATSLSLVTVAVSQERRAFALSLWTAITAAGSTLGPPLAGFVSSESSWRWFFALNAPLAVLFAGGVLVALGESRTAERIVPDRRGTLAFVVGMSLFVGGIAMASAPNLPLALALVSFAAGAALLFWFRRVERDAPSPLFDVSIFADRVYAAVSIVAFGANWAYAALILYTPVYLQKSLGESPASAGLMMLAFTVLYAAWSPAVGRLEKGRRVRQLLLPGLLLIAVGLVVLAFPDKESIWLVAVALAVSAIGQGLAFNTSGTVSMGLVGEDRAGVAAGLLSTVRQCGATVGLAASGAAYAAVTNDGGTPDEAINVVMIGTAAVAILSTLALPFLGRLTVTSGEDVASAG